MASAGIVPVAFAEEFLKGNPVPGLRAVTIDDCVAVVDAVAAWQELFRSKQGSGGFGFAYAADEFFLRTGRPIPPAKYYDDFAQYENGIGIARSFLDEGVKQIGRQLVGSSRIFLLTGMLAAGLMEVACDRLSNILSRPVQTLVAENRLFGSHVTVTGLLGGRDLIRDAREAGVSRGDMLLIPASSLDSAGERFLDDLVLEELEEALDCKIEVF